MKVPYFVVFEGFKPYLMLSYLLGFSRRKIPPEGPWFSLCRLGAPCAHGCRDTTGARGGAFLPPQKPDGRQSRQTAPFFMLILSITSASCLRGRMSPIDGGK